MSDPRLDERDFLLASIADLDREHAAGDLPTVDYETLRDDYTARAAAVLRSLEASPDAPWAPVASPSLQSPTGPPAAGWRRAGWLVGIVLFALGAGLLMARAVGSRGVGETSTGDIRSSTASLLAQAGAAFSAGDLDEARTAYDDVLEIQPSNAEALTYRGWLSWQSGDAEAAEVDLLDAVAADPRFPDARVFSAVVALRGAGDSSAAAEHLIAFDNLDPPPVMIGLVRQFGLRAEVGAALLSADDGRAIEVLVAASAPELLRALAAPIEQGEVVEVLGVIDAVIAASPEAASPVAARGFVLALSADAATGAERVELAAAAEDWVDRAVALDPASPDALAIRAAVRSRVLDDPEGAAADAATYAALGAADPDLDRLLADEGLAS